MRVLLLLDSYEEDGFTAAIPQLCQRWVPIRQITISSLAFGSDGPLADRLRQVGVGTGRVPCETMSDFLKLKEHGRKVLFRGDRPDLLQSFCRWPSLAARLFHANNPYVPLVLSVPAHEAVGGKSALMRLVLHQVEKRTRGWCRGTVVQTQAARSALEKVGVARETIHLIRPGVDAVQAFPLSETKKKRNRALMGAPEDCPLLISARRLDDPGFLDLLEVMPRVVEKFPACRLYLIGDGPMRRTIEHRIEELGLGECVRVIGHLSAILPKLLSTADICVHPFRENTFCLPVAQAQATGTPVIALRGEVMNESVLDGETGILITPGDREALTEAILELLGNPEKRESMGNEARGYIMESFELSNTAEQYIQLWKRIAPDAEWKATTGSIPLEEMKEIRRTANEMKP